MSVSATDTFSGPLIYFPFERDTPPSGLQGVYVHTEAGPTAAPKTFWEDYSIYFADYALAGLLVVLSASLFGALFVFRRRRTGQ